MKFEEISTETPGVRRVIMHKTHSEVSRETAAMFDPNEQLKAIVLQMEAFAKSAKLPLIPEFQAILNRRQEIMADHAKRKASAVPD